ncbi:hypothetical protein [Parasphingorhabdus sp.]|uniref:hypothetical protein n=1 Tax=Parasphingorhabdus sp. TaxID=2709688 RepID=UPI0032634989
MSKQASKIPYTAIAAILLAGCGAKNISTSAPDTKTAVAAQKNGQSAAADQLLGRYYLRGVMETASGLELTKDGKFRWYLIVGGLDVIGSGSWELTGDRVRLTYEDVKTNGEIPELTETILAISGKNLKPVDGSSGVYVPAKPAPTSGPDGQTQ